MHCSLVNNNSNYAVLNTEINALTDKLNIDLVHPGFNNAVLLEGTEQYVDSE